MVPRCFFLVDDGKEDERRSHKGLLKRDFVQTVSSLSQMASLGSLIQELELFQSAVSDIYIVNYVTGNIPCSYMLLGH